jgi:hypothetical protein
MEAEQNYFYRRRRNPVRKEPAPLFGGGHSFALLLGAPLFVQITFASPTIPLEDLVGTL